MDDKTLEFVMSLGQDADAVARWGIKLEGGLTQISMLARDSTDPAKTLEAIKSLLSALASDLRQGR